MYPKKITPNPLVSSTVEIRFKTDKDSSVVFKSFYESLTEIFPKVETTSFPKDLRAKNPELRYYPDYILSNENYSLSFNEYFLGFENITEYQLWENYSKELRQIIELIFKTNVIQEIERIGVRFQSAFNVEDFSSIINSKPSIEIRDFDENFLSYTTQMKYNEFDMLLRLKKDVTESGFNNSEQQGHIIDIDVFISDDVDKTQVFSKVDLAHTLLKKLFFDLLKEDFVKSLNPE